MGPFSQQIVASGIDVHVVLISDTSDAGNGICVPPPLGSGNCPDDSNPTAHYLHVPVGVSSNDALDKFVSTYPQWSSMLRPGALKYFVVVTDDNATDGPYDSAASFIDWVNNVDKAMFTPGNWKFDGIFASAAALRAAVSLELGRRRQGLQDSSSPRPAASRATCACRTSAPCSTNLPPA